MLFWKVFNWSIFISSQNSIVFPIPYFSALYLLQEQWRTHEVLLNLILFIFTGMDYVLIYFSWIPPPLEHEWHFLGDSISDKSLCEWTEMNCPEWTTELPWSVYWKCIRFEGKLRWYEVSFPNSYSSVLSTKALGRTVP